jgi:hypothetical protein
MQRIPSWRVKAHQQSCLEELGRPVRDAGPLARGLTANQNAARVGVRAPRGVLCLFGSPLAWTHERRLTLNGLRTPQRGVLSGGWGSSDGKFALKGKQIAWCPCPTSRQSSQVVICPDSQGTNSKRTCAGVLATSNPSQRHSQSTSGICSLKKHYRMGFKIFFLG